ncbi:hypothetical protein V495_01123 [Pseudogymnoascus sp. VKM F-4514 (FW-929)]|nr:hypothetical protein V495_01123 [Pseudogymnoascus sp. VKM F-4514 (FW-929)]KFY63995.1 hypothetical protein V497_01896 [Pseudogymnoascus sp. VKM F-4516 (FW-969)]
MLAPRSFLFSSTKQSASLPLPRQPPGSDTTPSTTGKGKGDVLILSGVSTESLPAKPASENAKVGSSNPVGIPIRQAGDASQRNRGVKGRRYDSGETSGPRPKGQQSQGKASAAVTSLLANTTIPPPRFKTLTRRNGQTQRLALDAAFSESGDSEKEYSPTLGGSPLDLLLCPLEDVPDIDPLGSDAESPPLLSYISKRTVSEDSVPSLTDNSIGGSYLSFGSSVSPQSRGKRFLPTRKLEPLASTSGDLPIDHPLSDPELDAWEMDFRVFGDGNKDSQKQGNLPTLRQKSAFKSNLTASLRALRSAAKSISNMTAPMITPDDFLTRSIISIDPKVPFTDERMPPRLDKMPTPALRRYLNPTTNAPIEAHVHASRPQTTCSECTASIQMETYNKTSKAPKTGSDAVTSKHSTNASPESCNGPVTRQRDMRENSDFIRVAVMEMRMRKNGKLDENAPGRARWALPPRQLSTGVYEINEGGVPLRWVGVTAG